MGVPTLMFAALAALVVLGGSFGEASADATVLNSDTVEVALSIEAPPGTSIVVHALDPGSEQRSIAMLELQSGIYRTRFETRPVDLVVVFEDLSTGAESNPARLTDLGVAPELVGVVAPLEPEESEGSSLGWLALGLGLASLSALAFWALGARSTDQEVEPSEPSEPVEADSSEVESSE